MPDIDKMTSDEWIAYRREKLDAYYASGKELKPDPECNYCDRESSKMTRSVNLRDRVRLMNRFAK